jgi:hypothetical protein
MNRKTVAAAQKYLTSIPTIRIAGVDHTAATIVAVVEEDIALADAATRARQDLISAAAAVRRQKAKLAPFRAGLRAFLENQFGDPATVAEFGYASRSPQVPSAETKALAVEKRKATRAARHTMGSRQRLKVKGAEPDGAPPEGSPP